MSRTLKNRKASASIPDNTLVLDNGTHSMKAGFVNSSSTTAPDTVTDCHIIPNCIARGTDASRQPKIYVADQLDRCKDFAEMTFRRPVEKGYVVNWEGELDIWKQVFFDRDSKLHCDPHNTNLLVTEAPNCPQALQHHSDEIIFEELEFASVYRCVGPILSYYNPMPPRETSPEAFLVLDTSYTDTTVTPLLWGRPLQSGVRRLDVGGKLLTNRLKEIVSLRQYNLMDDSHLVSQIKEDACFMSMDFKGDLDRSWKGNQKKFSKSQEAADESIAVEYVLPDYHNTTRGYVRSTGATTAKPGTVGAKPATQQQTEDILPLSNERFTISELLFSPSDISLHQPGIAELVTQSLSRLPEGLWPIMLANIIVVGGNSLFPNFMERLERELRALTPSECTIGLKRPVDPLKHLWQGGAFLAADKAKWRDVCVTKEEYAEHGAGWTAKRFATYDSRASSRLSTGR